MHFRAVHTLSVGTSVMVMEMTCSLSTVSLNSVSTLSLRAPALIRYPLTNSCIWDALSVLIGAWHISTCTEDGCSLGGDGVACSIGSGLVDVSGCENNVASSCNGRVRDLYEGLPNREVVLWLADSLGELIPQASILHTHTRTHTHTHSER